MSNDQIEAINKLRKQYPNQLKNVSSEKVPGKVLRLLRNKQNLTLDALAKTLGWGRKDSPDHSRISKYESVAKKPSKKTLLKIFIALNVNPETANLILQSLNKSVLLPDEKQRLTQVQLTSSKKNTQKEVTYIETGYYGRYKPLLHLATEYQRKTNCDTIKVGELLFHCTRLIGGDGTTTYSYPSDIKIHMDYTPYIHLPDDIRQIEHDLINKQRKKRNIEQTKYKVYTDRLKVRLQNWNVDITNQTEAPKPLHLYVQPTTFFTRAATNASLDQTLPTGRTIREEYASEHIDDFQTSKLANILAVNLMVITKDDWQIHYAVRGSRVADHPGGYAPAVSGTANWDDDKIYSDASKTIQYNPFHTAKREFHEEISNDITIDYKNIKFYGLARIFHTFDPFLYGTIYIEDTEEINSTQYRITTKELSDLTLTNRDNFDVQSLKSCSITNIGDTTNEIKKLIRYTKNQTDIAHSTFSTIFGLYMSLLYENPEKKLEINKKLNTV